MLAKQAWRVLIAPDSLCAKVLKAKYFPNSSLLQAQPMNGISYTFRSILKGVELLKEGLIWRIGDGNNVNIWSDPWLARDDALKPITARGQCVFPTININYVHVACNSENYKPIVRSNIATRQYGLQNAIRGMTMITNYIYLFSSSSSNAYVLELFWQEREHVPMERVLGPLPENAIVQVATVREKFTSASTR
jgi:hypothetical protein